MKKLLGLTICACVAIFLALGSTGCGDKKDKTKSPTPPAPSAKSDVKIDAIADVELPKDGDKTITIKIAEDAPEELKLSVMGDAKVKGAGTIAKGKKEGDLKITVTKGAETKELMVMADETPKTNKAEKAFKATYK